MKGPPACIYGTPKMHKFSSSDSFPKLRPIVSSIDTFNYNLACFLCDLLSLWVPKFLTFKLPNVSNKDALSICKRLLCNAVNKRNKELQHLSKESSLTKNFLSIQLSTIDFYIFTKSIRSHNKKSLQKSLYTQ